MRPGWPYRDRRPILVEVLQDLCPRCGSDLIDVTRPCPECGFDQVSPQQGSGRSGRGMQLTPIGLALLALGVSGLGVAAFGAGMRIGAGSAAPDAPDDPSAASVEMIEVAPTGRVRFAERLGDGLELESYRTQFTREDTIAWRAEFVEPPPTNELRLVITWVSIRERMQLSESTVTITDPELPMVARDEVAVRDLVPTAGLYEVTYHAGDVKLAVGVFELLPPDR